MKFGTRLALVLSACLLLVVPVLPAQTTGTIEGTVTDQNGGALPGVTVEATSPSLQGTRTAVTGNDGHYRFASVPPGRYTVTGNLSGMGTVQKNATVTLDATATVNLQIQLQAKETVIVTGEAPVVDVTSTTTGSNYSAKVIEKLPAARNYADIVRAQPGVQDDAGETQGRSLALSIYGATSAENLYIIDGVNTTNIVKGLQGKAINTEFVQEVEVKTGGYQAEYGRATGGVINVITKSGGNEFHGDLFGYYNPASFRANTRFDKTDDFSGKGDEQFSTTSKNVRRWDAGADLGGFFIKDRLWFFGAYDRVLNNDDVVTNTGFATGVATPRDSTTNLYSGKLTLNLAAGSTLVGTFFSDPEVRTGNGAGNIANANPPPSLGGNGALLPNTYLARLDIGGQDYAGRFNQLFGSIGVLTLQYARHQDRFQTTPFDTTDPLVEDRTNVFTTGDIYGTGGYGQIFGPVDNNKSKRDAYGGSFTAYLGNHEIKLGGDYEKVQTSESTYYTGGQYVRIYECSSSPSSTRYCAPGAGVPFTNAVGEAKLVMFRHYWNETGTGTFINLPVQTATVPTKNTGFFIQDTWRITPRLTVNAGLRWDREAMTNSLPPPSPSGFTLTNEWQPRAGFTYDFVGDGSSKIYGSYGRFYYNIPTDLNIRNYSGQVSAVTFNYSPTDLAEDPRITAGPLQQGGGDNIEAGTKGPYEDEYTIGVEKALDPTFAIGLKGTYRTLGRTVEDRCDLDYTDPLALGASCALMNPGAGGIISGGVVRICDTNTDPNDPNAGRCDLHTAVPAAKRIFRGIELTARKSFSQALWAQASLLFSSLKGNYSGAIRETDGQTDPGINADYDYAAFLNNAYGKLELDRPVQFRLDAVYTAPFGLSVGLGAYVRSGKPISRTGFYNAFYPTELFLDQRGSNGRMPTDYEANLSISYAISLGKVTVTPQLYIFNVFNRQTVTNLDFGYNTRGGTYCDPSVTTANGYSQATVNSCAGVPPGTAALDNPDYLKATARTDPRLVRGALKISF